ncbi:MAG: putative Ig domain-containing protein [Gammaproteobacteria bacterium]|nr:putative Ig domain-containing protein [Gammaproteobacteria bacterium]
MAAAEVLVGRTLTIRPTASDPDRDALTYQVSNLPTWMSFSSQTGVLTGTPTAGDVGVFNPVITVSDGKSQASGQSRITVSQSVAGRATLSWQAPTDNVDGSPLTDLAGFRVYYGNSANDLRYVIQVGNPGARSQIVEDLTVGTWYFAATAYDQSGGESARSNVTAKTIA